MGAEYMGALPANLSIGSMFRVLALLCLAVLSMGEPEPEAKAVANPKADPYLLYGGYYGLGHYGATTATLTTATTERDLPRLSLFLLLMLMPKLKLTRIFFMATMDLDIIMGATTATLTMAMAMVTTMASKKGRDPIES